MPKNLENTICDLVGKLMFYDRKEDEDLPVGAIEAMIKEGKTSVGEIVARFRIELEEGM